MATDRDEGEALTRQMSAEVAITRARVASDVEALGAKLAPQNLKTEAKLALTRGVERQSARVQRALTAGALTIARAAKRHRVSLALSLLGVGALIVWRVRRA